MNVRALRFCSFPPVPGIVPFAAKVAKVAMIGMVVGIALNGSDRVWSQEIPDDLLEDEHVREEFGVNQFTTPSIRKIFDDLQSLRPLPYEEMKRTIPEKTPTDRSKLALTVGLLIADGFFAVEAEQFYDLEPIGRSLLKHSKVLGAGTKISRHTKSLLEHGALNDWTGLKSELARTQQDVEKEMVMIRDVDVANLISLGGWLRAFEIGCAASLNPYDPKKAKVLMRPDIVEYFSLNLETMEPRLQDSGLVAEVAVDLKKIEKFVTLPDQEEIGEENLKKLRALVEGVVDQAYGSQLISKTKPKEDKTGPEKPAVAGTATRPASTAPSPAEPPLPTAGKPKKATGGVVTGEVKE